MRPRHTTVWLLIALLLSAAGAVRADPATGDALLADGRAPADATLRAFVFDASAPGEARLETAEPGLAGYPVRWGAPADPGRAVRLFLLGGSVLVTDRAWAASGLVRAEGDSVGLLRTNGWTDLDRGLVRWALLEGAREGVSVERLPGADEGQGEGADRVWLIDGDRLEGRIEQIDENGLSLTVGETTIDLPTERVTAVRFNNSEAEAKPAGRGRGAHCLVGLVDGSLLRATRVRADEAWLIVDSAEGFTLRLAADRLAFLQPLGGPVAYLSDLEPIDYRHTPYFGLAWPFGRDRLIRGGALEAAGRRAAKGLATHSAARLVYRLDGAPGRFQAEVAVADGAPGAAPGSVVFRVYLVRDGRFDPAYESPVVRRGDPPRPIDLDTTGAAGLALVVDYADQGDAGDQGLWLDARLVGPLE